MKRIGVINKKENEKQCKLDHYNFINKLLGYDNETVERIFDNF